MDTHWPIRRPVRELRPGDHAWLAYGGEEERRHVVGAFIGDGLAAGAKVVYLAGPAGAADRPRMAGSHDARLLTVVPLVPSGEHAGADGGADPRAALDALTREVARATADGHHAIRITADLTWAVSGPDAPVPLREWERRLGRAIGPSAIAVFQVDRRRRAAAVLDELRAAHAVVVTPDPEFEDAMLRIERTFQPVGLSLCGELDASRHTVLDAALATVLSGSDRREIHLDLAGLGFIDLGAINILADVAGRRADRGPLVLDRMSPQLRTLMETVGWGMLPGLRLGAGA
ncbi:MEDS domain-containing protein [Spirillospora sp. NBC_01491]|uniref:MEDS domain-containing protein n=1 Tax=Spirillospora sp. NBC_01491 TaxID=2976007 RepID=UPI002E36216E|nr:MEDS domain-containing protein [Spirillospora sp. NBC_01491]